MSKRQIAIKPKINSANTTYYDMAQADKDWLFNTIQKYAGIFLEESHSREDFRCVFFTPNKDLSKYIDKTTGKHAYNSYAKFMGGLIYNYQKYNGKNDVSKPQLNSIEELFELFNNYDAVCPTLEFVDWDVMAEESEVAKAKFFNDLFE